MGEGCVLGINVNGDARVVGVIAGSLVVVGVGAAAVPTGGPCGLSAAGVEGGLIGGLAGVEAYVDRRIVGVGVVVGSLTVVSVFSSKFRHQKHRSSGLLEKRIRQVETSSCFLTASDSEFPQ